MFIKAIISKLGDSPHIFGYGAMLVVIIYVSVRFTIVKSKLQTERYKITQLIGEVEGLKGDTTYLRESLRDAGIKISEVKNDDIKNNPTLIPFYPNIDSIIKYSK